MSGSNVTSDELSLEELERLHISQPLEAFIIEKVRDGFSIILTGNAGDGKTHLLKRLEKPLSDCGARVEPDATAAMRYGDVTPILNNWRKAIEQGKPYCLAANEYPLYQLRIKGREILPAIKEVDHQCRNRLVYGGEEDHNAFCEHIIVIDLSLRNPLAPSFAKSMLNKMLSAQALHHYAEQQADPVFIRNFVRLSEPYIQERLLNLFERIVRRGQRATIRELWILLARLLFGSDKKANIDQTFKSWYSTRLFEFDSRFALTALLKEYCDPAQYSHPQWDLQLERLQRDSGEEWQFGLSQLPIQTEIVEKSFTEIKRAFYFEHKRGGEAFALEEPYAQEFQRILSDTEQSDTIAKANLVASINACYCPVKFPGASDALMLWSGHRFHEQPTKSYIACQRVPTSDLTIALPRLPNYLRGQFDYQADHFELGYARGNQRARLLIDFSLYATLCKLKDGFPRKLLPERDINRLDLFMEQLHRLGIQQSKAFICFNVEQYSAARIRRLSSSGKTYQEVELYG